MERDHGVGLGALERGIIGQKNCDKQKRDYIWEEESKINAQG